MNERIKQLAKEAGYEADMFGVGHWDMPECKTFAKLIILDCINTASLSKLKGDNISKEMMRIYFEDQP